MRRLLPQTLFFQLVLGTAVVQTVLLLCFLIYVVVSQNQVAHARTRQRVALQIQRLAVACEQPIASGDTSALHAVLELSRIAPTIDVARVTNTVGGTLAVTENGRNRTLDAEELSAVPRALHERQIFAIRNGEIEAVTPLRKDGQTVALLWLQPNPSLSLNAAHTLARLALTYGGFVLLANLVPLFLIVRTMTRPIRRLRAATQGLVGNADLIRTLPLPVTSRNEAGELTSSFNAMAEELGRRRKGLLETLAQLDSMLEHAPLGLAFFDRDMHLVRRNRNFTDGCTAQRAEGHEVTTFFPPNVMADLHRSIEQVFQTGTSVHSLELSGKTTDSSEVERTWLMQFYPVPTETDPVHWVGVTVVEITERLKSEELLRKTEKLAAAGRLAASIAHEINNPLEAITNLLYLLRGNASLDADGRELVETAEGELTRVSEITQQTLRFHRQSTSPAQLNLCDVADSVVKLYRPRLTALEIEADMRLDKSSCIFGHSGELRQVLANLVGNAVDAMPGGGMLHLRVWRGCGFDRNRCWRAGVRLAVADTGTGMSPDTAKRIFEAFFTTKQATGTGLGLWVSEEIIRKHGGTISVRSRQGPRGGTVFLLFFPETGTAPRSLQTLLQ